MSEVDSQIMAQCEKHGAAFQVPFVHCLKLIVQRRRPNCSPEQLLFWVAMANEVQRFEALNDALAIMEVTS